MKPTTVRLMIRISGCVLLPAVLLWGGCRSWRNWNTWDLQESLHKLQEYSIRFGSISVGEPVPVKMSHFKFELDFDAKALYAEVSKSLQVAGRFGQFSVVDVAVALKASAPSVPEKTVAPVRRQIAFAVAETLLANAAADPSPSGTQALLDLFGAAIGSAAPATQPVVIPAREPLAAPQIGENPAAKRVKELADAANVFGDVDAQLTRRPIDLITETFDSHARKRWLEGVSALDDIMLGDDYVVRLFLTVISVSPGTVTKADFIAEASIRMKVIDDSKSKAAGSRSYGHPVNLLAVHPVGMNQSMDLQSFNASQYNILLDLVAQGYVSSGAARASAAQLKQQNVRALNQRVVVSSFQRAQTGHVGFRIRGEYWPIDPTNKQRDPFDPGDTVLLQDISVLALIVAVFDKGDMDPQKKNRLEINVATRWIPEKEKLFPYRSKGDMWAYLFDRGHRELAPTEQLYRHLVADRVYFLNKEKLSGNKLDWTDSLKSDSSTKLLPPVLTDRQNEAKAVISYESAFYAAQTEAIYAAAVGSAVMEQKLWRLAAPKIVTRFPSTLPADRPGYLIIKGEGFTADMAATVAGLRAQVVGTYADGKVALLQVDPVGVKKLHPSKGPIVVATKAGMATLGTPQTPKQDVEFVSPEGSSPAKPSTTITYTIPGQHEYKIKLETSRDKLGPGAYQAIQEAIRTTTQPTTRAEKYRP